MKETTVQPFIDTCRLIAESAADPIFLIGDHGRVVYANPVAEQVFGHPVREFLGHGLHDMIRRRPDGIPLPGEDGPLHQASTAGETVRDRIETFVRKDGSFITMSATCAPVEIGGGQMGRIFILRDPMRHTRAEQDLAESEQRFRLITDSMPQLVWVMSPDGIFSYVNERFRQYAGKDMKPGADHVEPIHPDDIEPTQKALEHALKTGNDYRVEHRARAADGSYRWFLSHGVPLKDASGKILAWYGSSTDIDDIRCASQRDTLTGLPNRALLFEYCEHLLAIAQRTRSSGALLFIDLDRFKPINDTHGHGVGDLVLKQVARRLQSCTRQEDIVGRLGGDEFVVALPHPDDVHGPATVARNIVERISEPYQVGDLQLHLSPSIGISLYPRHGSNLDALIKCADAAMYEAKKAGRKRYRFYAPTIDKGNDQQLQIELRLRDALERNELMLLYQPVMDLDSGVPTGAEALLRLPMPDGKALTPSQFLPVAESAGLINRIGEWVARKACSQHQQWRAAGLPEITIAINVAPQQFRQRSFIRHLASSVEHSGMDPSFLQIELKESSVLEDVHETIAALEEIRSIGIRVALDDFGVGYSSVRLLSSLPIDKLKIDQSFVSRIGRDSKSQVIADTVLALGRTLNLQVVGEGIESEEIFDYLRGRGCDQAQGYYFSEPLTADEFVHWFHAGQPERRALH